MAFDAEGYRKAAKDAGLSDEEIQKDIDEETKGIAAKGADADMANVKVGQDFMGIPEWLQPAAGLATAAALGAGATGLGMKLKDRMSKPDVAAAPRVEPTFGIPEMEPQPQAQPQGKFTPPQGDVTDVASRPVGDPRLQISGPKALPAPEVAVPTAAAPAPPPPAPTAPAPDVAVAPPAQTPSAPVQPKPMTEIERLRIEKLQFDLEAARAKEARAQEAHATRMANEAKRAEAATQKRQGQPKSNISAKDSAIIADNNEVKARAALVAAGQPKPPTASPVGGTSLPVGGVSGLPQGTPPAAPVVPPVAATPVVATPVANAPAVPPTTSLTKEQKGMKNYLVSQYGGGPEGEAAYKKTIDILGEVPAYEKGQGGGLSKEANNTIKEWRKANIEGPKVNLTHDMKKVMKGAGGAGILMALPGFAEAAQRKDMGKMSDIFTDFFVLPFAQSREAGMSKREEESIIANKFKEASKLGSPYRSVPPPR